MPIPSISSETAHIVPLSSVRLSASEESGDLSRAFGLIGDRAHQNAGNDPIPPWSVRFVYPPQSSGSGNGPRYQPQSGLPSKPSAGHPWPRSPRQSA